MQSREVAKSRSLYYQNLLTEKEKQWRTKEWHRAKPYAKRRELIGSKKIERKKRRKIPKSTVGWKW